jgi:hypothetical protein
MRRQPRSHSMRPHRVSYRQIHEVSTRLNDLTVKVADLGDRIAELAEEAAARDRETDRRFRETDARIDKTISATGTTSGPPHHDIHRQCSPRGAEAEQR